MTRVEIDRPGRALAAEADPSEREVDRDGLVVEAAGVDELGVRAEPVAVQQP